MQFVVLGFGGFAPGCVALSSADAATTVWDGALTPGALVGGLSSVALVEAQDLDAVTESLAGLAGAFEVRPAEPR
ncbi:hypothetical protein [Cellulomonas edaphi]|uniref:Uncharacterized protein n=1 Tax=Cellulomonas edaphi TaxID=3053468 RepID=A0ABT7S2U0_9CELL|nr:hypothetical protein [Cellulomons edaphi]MDM7829938.1 hypothetical protein [Cellulomons edaphi]